MNIQPIITGIQHIGIPTGDMFGSVAFFTSLGFSIAWKTDNSNTEKPVTFMQLGNLIIELYERTEVAMQTGAIDHIALDVKNIHSLFFEMKKAGHRLVDDKVQELPFWEHGVRFFTIIGPNEEKIEFCEIIN